MLTYGSRTAAHRSLLIRSLVMHEAEIKGPMTKYFQSKLYASKIRFMQYVWFTATSYIQYSYPAARITKTIPTKNMQSK